MLEKVNVARKQLYKPLLLDDLFRQDFISVLQQRVVSTMSTIKLVAFAIINDCLREVPQLPTVLSFL